jgi:hypothetical protein
MEVIGYFSKLIDKSGHQSGEPRPATLGFRCGIGRFANQRQDSDIVAKLTKGLHNFRHMNPLSTITERSMMI